MKFSAAVLIVAVCTTVSTSSALPAPEKISDTQQLLDELKKLGDNQEEVAKSQFLFNFLLGRRPTNRNEGNTGGNGQNGGNTGSCIGGNCGDGGNGGNAGTNTPQDTSLPPPNLDILNSEGYKDILQEYLRGILSQPPPPVPSPGARPSPATELEETAKSQSLILPTLIGGGLLTKAILGGHLPSFGRPSYNYYGGNVGGNGENGGNTGTCVGGNCGNGGNGGNAGVPSEQLAVKEQDYDKEELAREQLFHSLFKRLFGRRYDNYNGGNRGGNGQNGGNTGRCLYGNCGNGGNGGNAGKK